VRRTGRGTAKRAPTATAPKRKTIVQFLSRVADGGVNLDLSRDKDTGRHVDLM
jgi:hypothetical protein